MLKKMAALCAGLMVIGAIPAAWAGSCDAFGVNDHLPVLADPALTPQTTLLCHTGYASLNAGTVHEPLWSAERLTAEAVSGAERIGRVTHRFHGERGVPQGEQATHEDYSRTGYDRGHLVPSGDAIDARAQAQTFSYANVVPQTPALNEGIWAGVEMTVRDLATHDGVVYVVTGPSFHGELRTIGIDHVRVPSATWKAVYDPVGDRVGVYVCKNSDHPTCTTRSIAVLIHEVGVDPFPALSDTVKARAPNLPTPRDSPYTPRGHVRSAEDSSALEEKLQHAFRKAGARALRAIARQMAAQE